MPSSHNHEGLDCPLGDLDFRHARTCTRNVLTLSFLTRRRFRGTVQIDSKQGCCGRCRILRRSDDGCRFARCRQGGNWRARLNLNNGVCRTFSSAFNSSPISRSISGNSKPVTVTSKSISSSVRYCSSTWTLHVTAGAMVSSGVTLPHVQLRPARDFFSSLLAVGI